ncbi:hypothetical protein [Flavobacterium difficile]|uniref:Outer membrane protein beta-barrel domain-containing protein n=1 Tax=Flavobacterium difficile TaxID=2709659 RepID=A0ABX0I6H7_9FLAO|nr:hypothetical protein [Flavobacterium difficile]NHM02306.1 hypothetical protein [Flavobacterium difficile]
MLKNTLLLVLFFFSSSFYAQKIDTSKNELKSGKEDTRPPLPTEPVNHNPPSNARESNDNFGIGAFFVELGFYIGLYATIGDYRNEDHLYFPLTPHPYFDGKSGNYEKINDESVLKKQLRFDVENHFLYSNNAAFGNHLKGKFRPFQHFYLQTDYRALIERDKFAKTTSHLSLFQFNFGYDRLRFEKFNLGWTIGATYIANDINKAGFSYGLNTDVFPFKKISFNSAMIWSKVNGMPVNSFEFRGKYHKKNHFFSMGYENLKIASPSYNYVTLGVGSYF